MKIYPIQGAVADRKHWIVRWLRYTGYMEVIAAIIVGMMFAYNLLAPLLFTLFGDRAIATGVALLLGGLGSFLAGLAITLPVWALSMVIDDLHALRLYHQGFSVTDQQHRD